MLKILLVDGNKNIRECLRNLINEENDMKVIAEAESGKKAIQKARDQLPDIVVMDMMLPDMNGFDATRRLIGEVPGVKVIALSIYSDSIFVEEIFIAGASGYLLKDAVFEELIIAIRNVSKKNKYLSAGIKSTKK